MCRSISVAGGPHFHRARPRQQFSLASGASIPSMRILTRPTQIVSPSSICVTVPTIGACAAALDGTRISKNKAMATRTICSIPQNPRDPTTTIVPNGTSNSRPAPASAPSAEHNSQPPPNRALRARPSSSKIRDLSLQFPCTPLHADAEPHASREPSLLRTIKHPQLRSQQECGRD